MKGLYSFIAILFFVNIYGQHTVSKGIFSLTGSVRGQDSGLVTLVYPGMTGKMMRDTAVIINGNFSFTGEIPHPVPVTFRGAVASIADADPNCAQFYIDMGNMHLSLEKDHFKSFILTGSHTQKQNDTLTHLIDRLNSNSPYYFDSVTRTISNFIKAHPSSYVSAFELATIMSLIPIDSLLNLYNRIDMPVRESYYGKVVFEKTQTIVNVSAGKIAPLFSGLGIDQQIVSLSDFTGKYVLLDFWASWCIPCRKENPELIKLYQKYRDKGLEIIGISSDDDRESWLAAIRHDGTDIWNHILEYAEKDNAPPGDESISRQYGVLSLPTKILIDPERNIIQRFSFAQNNPTLEQVLELIFEKKAGCINQDNPFFGNNTPA